jgi:hypothetical protein
LYDNFGAATTRSSVLGPKWNKTSLTYYIDHTNATGLSNTIRETIIQAAFQKWANASYFTFTQTANSSTADITLAFAYIDGNSNGTIQGNQLARTYYPALASYFSYGLIEFDKDENWANGGSSGITLTVTIGSVVSLNTSYTIKLYNANGVLVRQTTSQGENVELDVSALPSGYYYLHIFNGSGDTQPDMRTIIVQH